MIIRVKFSTVSGNTPIGLSNGELALNSTDQKLFYRHSNGAILTLADGQLLGIDPYARIRANAAFQRANTSLLVAHLFSTANQRPSNTSPTVVSFSNTVILADATYTPANSFITVSANGTYVINTVGQLLKRVPGSATTDWVDMWVRKNGVNVPNSVVRNVIEGAVWRQIVLTDCIVLQANDQIQIMFAVSTILTTAYGLNTGSSPGGSIPSVTLTITRT